jgi:very-short-patch-repair endonuclease
MTTWTKLIADMEAQHGVIGRRQLDAASVTKSELQTWIANGRLERVAPRVWRAAGAPSTWHQRLHVGLLSLGRLSWVSHSAAARLHGFDRSPDGVVEFLVIRRRRSADLAERVHSTRRWGPTDEVVVDGLRSTSATRTVIDLANAKVHPDRLKAAIDSAVRLELSSPEAIRQRLAELRGRGRAGVRMLDGLLDDSGGHTMLERRFLELVRNAHLPRPETQVVFRRPDDGRFVARVDFLFRSHGVVVEVSGNLGHSSPSERARDAQRRNELQDLGLRVYEFTWEDVTKRSVFVIATLRTLLQAA